MKLDPHPKNPISQSVLDCPYTSVPEECINSVMNVISVAVVSDYLGRRKYLMDRANNIF